MRWTSLWVELFEFGRPGACMWSIVAAYQTSLWKHLVVRNMSLGFWDMSELERQLGGHRCICGVGNHETK